MLVFLLSLIKSVKTVSYIYITFPYGCCPNSLFLQLSVMLTDNVPFFNALILKNNKNKDNRTFLEEEVCSS